MATPITIHAGAQAVEATITDYYPDDDGRPVATVSTQVVEAGGSADFELSATRWIQFREMAA